MLANSLKLFLASLMVFHFQLLQALRIELTHVLFFLPSRASKKTFVILVSSTIRAFNVRKLTRSAQYVPPVRYIETGLMEAPADKGMKDSYSERGFLDVPATGSHGGADDNVMRSLVHALPESSAGGVVSPRKIHCHPSLFSASAEIA